MFTLYEYIFSFSDILLSHMIIYTFYLRNTSFLSVITFYNLLILFLLMNLYSSLSALNTYKLHLLLWVYFQFSTMLHPFLNPMLYQSLFLCILKISSMLLFFNFLFWCIELFSTPSTTFSDPYFYTWCIPKICP